MRPFILFAVVTLSVGSLAGAALAEPAGVKSDSPVLQAAKAKALNRMSVGFYRSLRTNRSGGATTLNASLKSNTQGAVNEQKLNVQRAALTNRTVPSSVARSANSKPLQSLTAADANYGAMGLSPASAPNAARMNKLH
jgi:hypothetical protein